MLNGALSLDALEGIAHRRDGPRSARWLQWRRTLRGMSSAAEVIDWNGHDVPEALRAHPPGRNVFERIGSAAEAGLTDEELERVAP